jgi:hypothetical protein
MTSRRGWARFAADTSSVREDDDMHHMRSLLVAATLAIPVVTLAQGTRSQPVVHHTKADAERDHERFDGKTSE